MVAVWNGFAGVVPFERLQPVKKFTDRRTAITRIWRAIQRLARAAHEGAPDAPAATGATQQPSPQKVAPKAQRGARQAQPKREAAAQVRAGSKKAHVIVTCCR